MQTQNKYKIQDKAFYLPLQQSCTIVDIKVHGFELVETIYEIEFQSGSREIVTESELVDCNPQFKPPKDVAERPKKEYTELEDGTLKKDMYNACECGAWATTFPNIHSTWCRKFIL